MDTLPYVLTSGWASGINVYATVLVTGLLGRYGGVEGVPEGLQRTEVLAAAAVMWALEFVADKVPYVDNVWDAIHTVIRPTIGAIVAALLAGQADDLNEALAAVLGGGTALATHAAKAGLRLGINASPEPVSNIVLSLAEDSAVVAVILFAVDHPWAALAIALTLLIGSIVVVVVLFRTIRGSWARLEARLGFRAAPPADYGGGRRE
jgi:Domain of unknown function (DUF4126)